MLEDNVDHNMYNIMSEMFVTFLIANIDPCSVDVHT